MVISKARKILFAFLISLLAFTFSDSLSAYALEDWELEWINEANSALTDIYTEKDIMATVYLCDTFDVKSQASLSSPKTVTVYSGQLVLIKSESIDEERNIWAEVSFSFRGNDYTGYILRNNLISSDEAFLDWETEYGMTDDYWSNSSMYSISLYSEEGEDIKNGDVSENDVSENEPDPVEETPKYSADIMEFPESYRDALQALKNEHPNWTFVKQYTGCTFQEAVDAEMKGNKSLVSGSFNPCTKELLYGDNWYYCSEEILKYYLDPRNGLDITHIFEFEQLTYNASYHTVEALENYLSSTFMNSKSNMPGMGVTFSAMIYALAKNESIYVSPFLIAARIIQEQGVNGGSSLISGTYPGYEGLYNYFNIGASGQISSEIITSGLKTAYSKWGEGVSTVNGNGEKISVYGDVITQYGSYNSIVYGARFLSGSYINNGQDTLYLQKYNVNPSSNSGLFNHQYMQNISAAFSESYSTMKMYNNANALNNAFVFKIPVFDEMPETPCEKPTTTTKAVITLPDGYEKNGVTALSSIWLDGIEHKFITRRGYLVVDTENNTTTNAVIYKYNSSGVCTGMYVWTLQYQNGAYKVTYQPELEDLLTYHGFSIRISGDSGIRFKTGINTELRQKLLTSGVNGYKATEYGTLSMYNIYRTKYNYPFILGTNVTGSGVAYGYNTKGEFVNSIFETKEGRDRFTSVLVGIEPKYYKMDIAFRGYIKLTNGSTSTTIYGPPVASNIYHLAELFINAKAYAEGSDPDLFLRKIISDADALQSKEGN